MSKAIIMIYINITSFALISKLEKDHSMIETRRLKNIAIFFQTILSFVLSRKIINNRFNLSIIKKLIKLFYLHHSCKKVPEKSNQENLKVIKILCQRNQEILKASKNQSSWNALRLISHSWRRFAQGVLKVVFFTVLCFK